MLVQLLQASPTKIMNKNFILYYPSDNKGDLPSNFNYDFFQMSAIATIVKRTFDMTV